MVEIHAWGGSEAEGYAPIVGAGPNSTSLHYDKLSRKIEDGDIVVLDVGAQYSGYSADITRTLPANGKFTRASAKSTTSSSVRKCCHRSAEAGRGLLRQGRQERLQARLQLHQLPRKRSPRQSLGPYFIHGLGHHIGPRCPRPWRVLRAAATRHGRHRRARIYIPEENLGVRIEDDVLITESGHKLLSERLPRDPVEIEKIMAVGADQRAKESKKGDDD